MTPLVLLIAALAVARFTNLIVHDSILEPIRHTIFLWSPPYDDVERGFAYQNSYQQGKSYKTVPRDPGFFGQLLACQYCVGVWVAILAYATIHYNVPGAIPILTVAALAQSAEAITKASR